MNKASFLFSSIGGPSSLQRQQTARLSTRRCHQISPSIRSHAGRLTNVIVSATTENLALETAAAVRWFMCCVTPLKPFLSHLGRFRKESFKVQMQKNWVSKSSDLALMTGRLSGVSGPRTSGWPSGGGGQKVKARQKDVSALNVEILHKHSGWAYLLSSRYDCSRPGGLWGFGVVRRSPTVSHIWCTVHGNPGYFCPNLSVETQLILGFLWFLQTLNVPLESHENSRFPCRSFMQQNISNVFKRRTKKI